MVTLLRAPFATPRAQVPASDGRTAADWAKSEGQTAILGLITAKAGAGATTAQSAGEVGGAGGGDFGGFDDGAGENAGNDEFGAFGEPGGDFGAERNSFGEDLSFSESATLIKTASYSGWGLSLNGCV